MRGRTENILLWGTLILVIAVGFLAYIRAEDRQVKHEEPLASQENTMQEIAIEQLKEGSGAEATRGKRVSVHYVGVLQRGEQFDSSRDRGEPLSFTLGSGELIPGFEQGVAGMRVGGMRKVAIPPSLGYGAISGHPLQNEILTFEIELLSVQ